MTGYTPTVRDSFVPIIKPVSYRCNLRCPYCYYGPESVASQPGSLNRDAEATVGRMPEEVLKELVREACRINSGIVQFIWHGGEPLLAGIGYYKKAIDYQNRFSRSGQTVANSVQTNGTLIDAEWVEFLASNKFKVGVSLDGPEWLHNGLRVNADGSGSFVRARDAIQDLKEAGTDPGVICTVTQNNVEYPVEIYQCFRRLGVKQLKFTHLHEPERQGHLAELAVEPSEYASFIKKIFECWLAEDDPEVYVSEIFSIVSRLMGGPAGECIHAGECDLYWTIEADGTVYPCDTVPGPREVWNCGNITEGLDAVFTSPGYRRFMERFQLVKRKAEKKSWSSLISCGCLGDYYPTIDQKSSANTFATAWSELAQHIRDRLIEFGYLDEGASPKSGLAGEVL